MRNNNSAQWSYGVRTIQWAKSSDREAIKMAHHQALTGNVPRCGLRSQFPDEICSRVLSAIQKEKFERLLEDSTGNPDASSVNDPLLLPKCTSIAWWHAITSRRCRTFDDRWPLLYGQASFSLDIPQLESSAREDLQPSSIENVQPIILPPCAGDTGPSFTDDP